MKKILGSIPLFLLPLSAVAKISCENPVSYPSNHGHYVAGQRFNVEIKCQSDVPNASLHYAWSSPLQQSDSPSVQFKLRSSAAIYVKVTEQLACSSGNCTPAEYTSEPLSFHIGSTCRLLQDPTSGTSSLQCPGAPVQADGTPRNTSDCGTNPAPAAEACANPVNTASGTMWHEQIDFVVKGRTPATNLQLRRVYTANAASVNGIFGPNWNSDYETSIIKYVDTVTGRTDVIWIDESGGPYTFLGQADGSFSSPPGLQILLSSDLSGSNPLGPVYILRKKDNTTYFFSAAASALNGKILQKKDPHGESISFSYDAQARLSSVSAPFAGQITFTYNGFNQVATVTRVRDNLTYTYDYFPDHHLRSVTDFANRSSYFTYVSTSPNSLAQGKLETITDNGNKSLRFTYDSQGRALQQFESGGAVWKFSYGDHQTQVTRPNGYSEIYYFDSNYREIRHEFADGAAFNTSWNAQGYRSQTGFDLLGTTQFGYDSNGNMASIQRPLDPSPIRIQYDQAFNVPVLVTPLVGAPTAFTINPANGDIVGITRAGSSATLSLSYTRDSFGNLLSTNNGLGSYADQRDSNGFLTQKFDGHNPISLSYDARGRVSSATWQSGRVLNYTYNDDDQVVKVTDTNGPTLIQQFDYYKRLSSQTIRPASGADQVTSFTYDARDRLVQITDATGHTKQFVYDSVRIRDFPIQVIDESGKAYNYSYDSRDRLISKTDPNGGVTSYTYDVNGNVTSVTDAVGNVTQYTYDLNNRLLSETRPSAASSGGSNIAVRVTTNRFYDIGDHLLRSEKVSPTGGATRALVFTYDDFDRIISKTTKLQGATDTVQDAATYAYSPQLDAELLTQAKNFVANETFSYEALPPFANNQFSIHSVMPANPERIFNADYTATIGATGKVEKVVDGTGTLLFTKSYDAVGRLAGATVGPALQGAPNVGVGFDQYGRPLGRIFSDGQLESFQYNSLNRRTGTTWQGPMNGQEAISYSPSGDVTAVTRENGYSVNVAYSNDHQITDVSGSEVRSVRYDGVGNRLSDSQLGAGGFVSNFLASNGVSQFSADADGFGDSAREVSTTNTKNFTFNVEDRITRFQDNTSNVGYSYDALGRRVGKVFNVGNPIQVFYHDYSYLGLEDRILQARGSDGTITTYVDGDALDDHLFEYSSATGAKSLVVDHLGSVLNGNVSGPSSRFSVFGELTAPTTISASTASVNYGFSGREYDVESGTSYNRDRSYNPSVGRWLSQEPLGASVDVNYYRYVYNQPLGLSDPSGKNPVLIGVVVLGGLAGAAGNLYALNKLGKLDSSNFLGAAAVGGAAGALAATGAAFATAAAAAEGVTGLALLATRVNGAPSLIAAAGSFFGDLLLSRGLDVLGVAPDVIPAIASKTKPCPEANK